jgi:cellulose synthase/poly-beta-1,6-N-acetylglucosamine synthase-like glycosyltransferase
MASSLAGPPHVWTLSCLQAVAVAAYVLAQLVLCLYASHRYLIVWRWWRLRRTGPATSARRSTRVGDWPSFTVQLPLYNERNVVERAIDAAAALDYPRDRLEVQVLDDSSDGTDAAAHAAAARHRRLGLDVRVLHRSERRGFKAGAMAAGLAEARGDLIAVFDADFVPPPDFLRRIAPHFDSPEVGMVQARWAHLNRGRSLLTAAQAAMLDSHFLLEHSYRMSAGLFFNFNGTAGVWRRRCVEEAGGWSHETLTEDLDLSYRAQLKGWRFVFEPDLAAPAELPADMEALKSQQRRWAKGSIQTARKLMPSLWRTHLPLRVKLEAFLHLTANVAYPLLLVLALLLPPILAGPARTPAWLQVFLHAAVLAFGVVPVALFLAAGGRASGGRLATIARDSVAALVLGVGLSVNNARAVIEGLGPRVGDWERTPKTGEGYRPPQHAVRYPSATEPTGRVELALALYAAGVGTFAWLRHAYPVLPFAALLLVGFGSVGWASWRDSRAAARIATGERRARSG